MAATTATAIDAAIRGVRRAGQFINDLRSAAHTGTRSTGVKAAPRSKKAASSAPAAHVRALRAGGGRSSGRAGAGRGGRGGGKAKAPAGGGAARVSLPDANGKMRTYRVGSVTKDPDGSRWRAMASGWSHISG